MKLHGTLIKKYDLFIYLLGQMNNKEDEIKSNPRKVFSTALDRIWSELASSG